MNSAARAGLLALLLGCSAQAQQTAPAGEPAIKVQGLLSGKAVLQIGAAPPKLMRVGETLQGVKLLAADAAAATVLVNGQRKKLGLSIGNPLEPAVVSSQVIQPYIPPPEASAEPQGRLEIPADARGHFHLSGQVNGKRIPFVVDTGATLVVLPEALAKSLGYTPNDGRPIRSRTTNGTSLSYHIVLKSLRLGGMSFTDVDAIISPTFDSPEALLGMSVLRQLQFQQRGSTLILSALPASKSRARVESSGQE